MKRYWRQAILPDVPWLLAIAAVAMALRIAWVVRAETFPVPGMDTLFYDNTARSLADGLGYINTGGVATALFPPGYSHALAGVYKVFGASLQAGQAFNVGISVALVFAIYALGRIAWDRSAALLGALIWALFPSQIIWTSLLMPEMLFTLAFVLSLALVFVSERTESARTKLIAIAVAGAFAGAATLIRGQAIGLWLVVALWLLLLRRPAGLKRAALYTLLMFLVLVPWTVRNARELHAPVLVSTNVGWNAVIGHHDYADGGFWSPAAYKIFDKYIFIPNPKGQVERNKAGVRMALNWARSHPVEEIDLARKKAVILWRGDADAVMWQELGAVPAFMSKSERQWLRKVSNVFYYGVLAAAGVGLITGLRRSHPWALLVLLIALYWTAFHILFFAANRYHYPLLPLISLAAAAGLLSLAKAALPKAKQWRKPLGRFIPQGLLSSSQPK